MTVIAVLKFPTPITVCPAILKMYVLNGVNESAVRLFEVESNPKDSIVSRNVILIVYPVITPFWSSKRGDSQVRKTDRDDVALPKKFCGGPLGTAHKESSAIMMVNTV